MNLKRLLLYCFLSFILSILSACDDGGDWEDEKENLDLVNLNDPYRGLKTFSHGLSVAQSKSLLKKNGLASLEASIKYDVSVHRFEYQTTYKNKVVTATGVISIPVGKTDASILVFHHGTLFEDAITPSEFTSQWGNDLMAASGYITLTPDYIGYGPTKDIIHPYHIYQPLVDASIDMIIAAKTYFKKNDINFADDGIFLGGFSEGGYAAFAVQKEIETHPAYNITIKASAPGAGAYDLTHQFKVITTADDYPVTAYALFALTAYNDYYWHLPLKELFLPPYDVQSAVWLNGTFSEDYLVKNLPKKLSIVLNPDFTADFNANTNSVFSNDIQTNNLNNFVVESPTRFIHGTKDDVVPFAVAQKTYNDLVALGTSPETLKLQPYNGGHAPPIYIGLMIEWFNSFE